MKHFAVSKWAVSKLALSPRDRIALVLLTCGAVALQFGLGDPVRNAVSVPLALALAWAALIDRDRLRLPDLLTLPIIALGLGHAAWIDPGAVEHYLIGAVLGYGALVGIDWAFHLVRGEHGLGLGDAKLLAGAGAWLGWAALPSVVVIASGAGLFGVLAMRLGSTSRGRPERQIAFGPYLVIGFWFVWLFGGFQARPY